MSDGKNDLKLPGDHTDLNLNPKTILSPLFDPQKAFLTKKSVIETFHFLVLFVPSDISAQREIQGDKRIEIMT